MPSFWGEWLARRLERPVSRPVVQDLPPALLRDIGVGPAGSGFAPVFIRHRNIDDKRTFQVLQMSR